MADQEEQPAEQISHEEFFRLFSQNERSVSAYIVSLVPNWADADDLIQETNLRLWDQRARYAPGTNFGAWACTIARFEVLTYRKKKMRERLQFTDEFVDAVSLELQEDDTKQRHLALAGCIERLSDNNARMLRAFYHDHAMTRQVAIQFGRSVEALTKAIWRIRKTLHDCIEQQLQRS